MNMTAAIKASRETSCRISISKERLSLASYDLKPHGIFGGFKFFSYSNFFLLFFFASFKSEDKSSSVGGNKMQREVVFCLVLDKVLISAYNTSVRRVEYLGRIVQLVRTLHSHCRGPWFESRCDHHAEGIFERREDLRHEEGIFC